MIKEIVFRDPSDPKYNPNYLETNDKLEAVIAKIKMILYTNRGEVLGEPELGMDLEDYLFEKRIDEKEIRDRFYSQVARFIPEREYKLDLEISHGTDNIQNYINLYVTINGLKAFGIAI